MPEPVAIVGMGCRWPGGVQTPPQFWEFLRDRKDGWAELGQHRYSADGFYHPNPERPGTMAQKGAFLLNEDARLFDHSFFGISSLEAETMDPGQRKLLEVSYEALESAGQSFESVSGSRTGVFVGNFSVDHWMIQQRDWDNPRPYAFSGAGTSILSNRISYIFNLKGPSLTIDTACSSSMHALHLAMNSIRSGDCEAAIVASSNWIGDPGTQMALDKMGALSSTSRCHTFDAKADGYARGEGYGALYLKKASLALIDGSPIRALVRGSSINANGRSVGISRPSVAGQEDVIREAYWNAGNLPLDGTTYFECHGTGTSVGDPIEVAAVGNVFAPGRSHLNPMLVGSVKTNVGHSEGASALASIMKVHSVSGYVKAGVNRPNLTLNGNLWINGAAMEDGNPLRDQVRRDQRQDLERMTTSETAATRRRVLLPLSANSAASLKLNIEALTQASSEASLADLAYTLSAKRSKLPHRTFRVVSPDSMEEDMLIDKRPIKGPAQPTKLGFIFTGQGAQWHAMGAGLFEFQVFRSVIQHLDDVLGTLPWAPTWTLADVLAGNCDEDLVHSAQVSQPVCTALQIGIVDLLASWSVFPTAVAGHSSGEMAAAYAAGRLTAAEAIVAAYCRGLVLTQNRQSGSMLAVGLGLEPATALYLRGHEDRVRVAAINSPGSVTLSGDTEAIEQISAALTESGVFNRLLKTGGNAYHSLHMAALGQSYEDMLIEGLSLIRGFNLCNMEHRYRPITWVSSVAPGKCHGELDGRGWASYWRANLESCVRFSEAIATMTAAPSESVHCFVEVGAHGALKGPLNQIPQSTGRSISYVAAMARHGDGLKSVLHLAGTLFCLDYRGIDLAAVNAVDAPDGSSLQHGSIAVDLPPIDTPTAPHDLLGSKVPGTTARQPQWRNIVRKKDLPWLEHYTVQKDTILPAAGLIAMAVEAANRSRRQSSVEITITGYELRDIHIKSLLSIPEDDYGIEVVTSLCHQGQPSEAVAQYSPFVISSVSRTSNQWTEHCTGFVRVEISSDEKTDARDKEPDQGESGPILADARSWYKTLASLGTVYGTMFQTISNIRSHHEEDVFEAIINLNSTSGVVKGGEADYPLHPTALEGVLMLGLIASHRGCPEEVKGSFSLFRISYLYLKTGSLHSSATAIANKRAARRTGGEGTTDLQLWSQDDQILLDVEGLTWESNTDGAVGTFERNSPLSARLIWKPDIRLLSNQQAREMFPPPQENVDISPLWGITTHLAHLITPTLGRDGSLLAWIERMATSDMSNAMQEARGLSDAALELKIDLLAQKAPKVIEVQIMQLLRRNMAEILSERKTGIDVIINADLLTPLYKTGLLMTSVYPHLSNVMEHISHVSPSLRILEIGGGTGGATRIAMKALGGASGYKRYKDYTFTDVSPGFLSSARDSMGDLPDVHFSVLDCEADPMAQGYEACYDLVLACQVLHATSSMAKTMSNVRKLLKPGGWLVLVETNRNFTVPGIVVGTFTGYWYGVADGRADAPFQGVDAWDTVLKRTGFSGVDVVLDDFPEPHNTTSVMLSRAVAPEAGPGRECGETLGIQLLYDTERSPQALEEIKMELEGRGHSTSIAPLNQALQHSLPSVCVVIWLGCEETVSPIDEHAFTGLSQIAKNSTTTIVLTENGLGNARGKRVALSPCLLERLRCENKSSRLITVEVDLAETSTQRGQDEELARVLVEQLMPISQPRVEDLDGDGDFVWQDGCLRAGRLVPVGESIPPRGHSASVVPMNNLRPSIMAFGKSGDLQSLHFRANSKVSRDLPPDHIEVKITANGLVQTDLASQTRHPETGIPSFEYSGVVGAVGADVTNFKTGDHVYGLRDSSVSTVDWVPASMAQRQHAQDDSTGMATMPLAYTTAFYALDHVAHLRPQQKMLIDSADGPFTIALVRLAKARGADVYALSNDPEPESGLRHALGDQPPHFLSPRDAKLRHHGTYDVIVILSVDREAETVLEAYSRALAPLGHMVYLSGGNNTTPVFNVSQPNINFTGFDISTLIRCAPDLCGTLMCAVDDYYRRGLIGPIQPFTAIDVAEIFPPTVFDSPVKVESNVKLVVTIKDPTTPVKATPPPSRSSFDPEGLYVINGCPSNREESLTRWFRDHGARHIMLLSSTSGDDGWLRRLSSYGIEVRSLVGDVSDRNRGVSMIRDAFLSSPRPISGILHFSGLNSSENGFHHLVAEAEAVTNLHELSISYTLDFFTMVALPLATTSLENSGAERCHQALAQHRRRLGFRASTVSSCMVDSDLLGDDNMSNGYQEQSTSEDSEDSIKILSDYQFVKLIGPALLDRSVAPQQHSTNLAPECSGNPQSPLPGTDIVVCLDPEDLVHVASERSLQMPETMSPISPSPPSIGSSGRMSHLIRALADRKRREEAEDVADGSPVASQRSALIQSTRRSFDQALRSGADRHQTTAFVERAIRSAVADVLFIDVDSVDMARPVADQGLDSLVAAELRGWFQQALGVDVKTLELLDQSRTMQQLAGAVVERALSEHRKT
ncbi:hypothetical protein PG997_008671 [Apiospora hydei]|uniref:Polyketide synthase n=1 Tax=Apiospora hydei TaxID=1337664 RepID=A0ABR1WFH8_9PEZI